MSEEKKQIIEEEESQVITRFEIPGMPKENPLHMIDASQRIIQHYVQSYDKYGRVIVVKGDSEDLEKSIGQYQSEVGPKNVVAMLAAGGDPKLLSVNTSRQLSGNFVDMDFKGANEAQVATEKAQANATKALADFNEKYHTNLDINTFLSLYEKGLLEAHVAGVNTKADDKSAEGEK